MCYFLAGDLLAAHHCSPQTCPPPPLPGLQGSPGHLARSWSPLAPVQHALVAPALQQEGLGIPWRPVVRARRFHCWGTGSIPGRGTKILRTARPGQKTRKPKTTTKQNKQKKTQEGLIPLSSAPPGALGRPRPVVPLRPLGSLCLWVRGRPGSPLGPFPVQVSWPCLGPSCGAQQRALCTAPTGPCGGSPDSPLLACDMCHLLAVQTCQPADD